MSHRAHEPRVVIADFGQKLRKAVEETPFTLFVCGPSRGQKSPSGILRRYISAQIERKVSGVTVVWGEHQDFRGRLGNVVLRKFNDVTKELDFASKQSDLVVIFPDSPGSFVELGMFGMHQRICHQLVIVFDRRYRSRRSFAIDAMGKAAKNLNAIIKFVRYQDRQTVLREIETLVRNRQESKYNAGSYASR